MPLFVQILAALYQEDIVDEDSIRKWLVMPVSRGVGLEAGDRSDNIRKCFELGTKMLQHLEEQDDDSEDSEDSE